MNKNIDFFLYFVRNNNSTRLSVKKQSYSVYRAIVLPRTPSNFHENVYQVNVACSYNDDSETYMTVIAFFFYRYHKHVTRLYRFSNILLSAAKKLPYVKRMPSSEIYSDQGEGMLVQKNGI